MPAEPPYLRIAAEIKDRIARGELKAGQKIPSTRRITQEWGVAMATATKVIATLREDGVVDTKPGAGTVVRSVQMPHAPKIAPEPDLSRDRIVRAAITVADAEGLPMVTMRRVATDLGVATMSLYRHVSSKDDLVLYMADTVFGEQPFPQQAPPGWRACLELAARLMWTVCRRHPWAAEALSMTRPRVSPNLLAYTEWVLAVLQRFDMSVDEMMYTHLNLYGHVRGLALTLQSETQARQDTGVTHQEWIETEEPALENLLVTGRYPAMAVVLAGDFGYDLDTMFEYGLRLLLDGVDRQLRDYTEQPADRARRDR